MINPSKLHDLKQTNKKNFSMYIVEHFKCHGLKRSWIVPVFLYIQFGNSWQTLESLALQNPADRPIEKIRGKYYRMYANRTPLLIRTPGDTFGAHFGHFL